jgi:cephalosporin hydroxylase
MQHSYYLYNVIDQVMIGNPDISGIVEIGTGYGALTEFLGLWGLSRGVPIVTVDHVNIHDENVLSALGITYFQTDEFSDEFIDYMKKFIDAYDRILFICDGGNKPKEFNFWAPLLKTGSIIAAHDWGTEIKLSDISETVNKYCTPYAQEGWNRKGIRFALFRIN